MPVKDISKEQTTHGPIPTLSRQCGSIESGDIREDRGELQNEIYTSWWKPSLVREVIDNKFTRFKFVLSILVTLAMMALGYNVGQIGPAFPDLMEITSTDLEKASAIMTSYFSGRLVGSGIGGILYSKMNTYLMFVVSLIIEGAVVAAIPWCSRLELMIAAHALHGISGGVLNVAVTSTSMPIWGTTTRGRSYIQMLYVFYAVSIALAPIGTAPFVHETEHVSAHNNITDISTPPTIPAYTRVCSGNPSCYNTTVNASKSLAVAPESTLYVAYSISSGITILIAVPFIILYLTSDTDSTRKQNIESCTFLSKLSRIANYLQFINIGVFSGLFAVIDLCYPAYLTVFCVQHLNWTKTSGAMITSLFSFATLCGRFGGIFLVPVMKSHTTLLFSTTIYSFGFVFMTASAYLYADIGVWISACVIGLSIGITWPSTLSWVNSYLIPVGGKVSGYLLVVAYFCTLFGPVLLGYLMQEVSLLWFCYICLIASGANVINVIFMVIYTIYSDRNRNTYQVQISTIE